MAQQRTVLLPRELFEMPAEQRLQNVLDPHLVPARLLDATLTMNNIVFSGLRPERAAKCLLLLLSMPINEVRVDFVKSLIHSSMQELQHTHRLVVGHAANPSLNKSQTIITIILARFPGGLLDVPVQNCPIYPWQPAPGQAPPVQEAPEREVPGQAVLGNLAPGQQSPDPVVDGAPARLPGRLCPPTASRAIVNAAEAVALGATMHFLTYQVLSHFSV